MTAPPPIRATFEVGPAGAASAFGFVVDGPADRVPAVVDEAGGRAVVEFPSATWCDDVTQLVAALVAGEAMELAALERCRLVDLDVPDGLLPGPAFAAPDRWMVGAAVRPAVGLSPAEAGEVAATIARAGADLVCDDPLLGDPPWCPMEERLGEVVRRLPGDVVYCVNVTGPAGSLRWRAERALELGATGLMVCAGAQGIDAVRLLRECEFGVPLLAHRVGAAPMIRNERFGCTAEVLTLLLRWCGADVAVVGSYGGNRFDTDADVDAQVDACRRPLPGEPAAAVAALTGGIGPENSRAQLERAGGTGLMALLNASAYQVDGGIDAAVRSTVDSLADGLA